MVTRLISANASEIVKMNGDELKQSIKASEGRTVLSENVVTEPAIDNLTTSEIAAAFGADLILLNLFDTFNPKVEGLHVDDPIDTVVRLKKLTGRPIGVNLEPVDEDAEMESTKLTISKGRTATAESIKKAEELGFNFVCFTGNPGTGVTNKMIEKAIKVAKKNFSGLIIAGKMHGAGVDEPVADEISVRSFIEAGADVILVPAVGTVPGFTSEELVKIVKIAHKHGALVMSTIGTSQESSGAQTVHDIALQNKICGVDMQHIGDAGWGVVPPTDTIFELSKTIRGMNHTISRMARSINR
ncbi:haloacid dehalogenase-like hydrolase [Lactobacillus sp. LL6]|uniref:DUF7916 family protein n=1 Tax=Lactobacillus sp. LL6 TaxID=2596827 RepID=UPI0011859B85|nr:haloacid dehalogenase-like hydrolase [Lactobacillus sp. LL6]TSO25458.1 haloacid dehalogenase-like hydrolase [Lactobacillus sp. LL6]